MSYIVNQHELESVTALPTFERYQYFINKIADWNEVWSLGDESGWSLMSCSDGVECVPVWPAEAYVLQCCNGVWKDCFPKHIALTDWQSKWMPGIDRDGRRIAVFPVPANRGIVITPPKMAADIESALQQFG